MEGASGLLQMFLLQEADRWIPFCVSYIPCAHSYKPRFVLVMLIAEAWTCKLTMHLL